MVVDDEMLFGVGVTDTGRLGKVHYSNPVDTILIRTPHHAEHLEREMIDLSEVAEYCSSNCE